jgi:hypothetical protein
MSASDKVLGENSSILVAMICETFLKDAFLSRKAEAARAFGPGTAEKCRRSRRQEAVPMKKFHHQV